MLQSRRHPDCPQWRDGPITLIGFYRNDAVRGIGELATPMTVGWKSLAVDVYLCGHDHVTRDIFTGIKGGFRHGPILNVNDLELKAGHLQTEHITTCATATCHGFYIGSQTMQRKHLILAVFVTAIWGLNFPITKLGLAQINPLLLTAIRFTFAAIPWVFLVKKPKVANRWLVAYGLIFGVAMWALINLGISMGVPPGDASLLIQFSAFFTLGWGIVLFREKLMWPQVIGVGMAAAGLIGILHSSPGKATTIGFALVMVSALAWSIGNVVIKISKVREIFAFVVWASLIPPIPLFLLTWWLHGSQPFIALASHVSAVALFSLAFQVYAATHFCYWGWNLLLREYPTSRVAPLSLLIPAFGTVSSIFIVHQVPNSVGCISIALILAALVIGLRNGRPVWVRGSKVLLPQRPHWPTNGQKGK